MNCSSSAAGAVDALSPIESFRFKFLISNSKSILASRFGYVIDALAHTDDVLECLKVYVFLRANVRCAG